MPESSRPTIYSRLHEARTCLEGLRDVPAHRLHLLDEQVSSALQPSASSSSASSAPSRRPLSRADFHDVLSSLRQATRSFAESIKPITASVATTSHDGLSSSSTSSNLDRYTSLLREQSQHVAQLASSLDPIESLARLTKERDAKTLPPSLYVGALRHTATAPLGKRKRSEGDEQADSPLRPASLDDVVSIAASLSSAIDELAKSLGLETFAEAHPIDKEAADKGGELNTHTLTLGGRILVIDLDLGVQKQQESMHPRVKVRVSFATDSATAAHVNGTGSGSSSSIAESSSNATKNAKLAAVLREDVEGVVQLLFGVTSDTADVLNATDVSIEEHRARQAIDAWQKLRKNLAALARIDQLSGTSSDSGGVGSKEPSNLFSHLAHLHETVSTAAGKSELPCGPVEVQEVSPFTRVTLRDVQPPLALDLGIDECMYGQGNGQGSTQSDEGHLGPLPSRQLSFVARLNSPLVLPRRLAARLGNIIGMSAGSFSSSTRQQNVINGGIKQSAPQTYRPPSRSYASLLSTSSQPAEPSSSKASSVTNDADGRQQVKLLPSLDEEDQHAMSANINDSCAVLVSFFPFQTTRQLFASIAVLQQGSSLARLLRPVVRMQVEEEEQKAKAKPNGGSNHAEQQREVTLEEMLRPPTGPIAVVVSLEDERAAPPSERGAGLSLTSQLWESTSAQMVYLTASVRLPALGGLEVKARLTADVGMALRAVEQEAGGNRGDGDGSREMDNERAAKIAAQLTSSGDLQLACEEVVRWAKGEEEHEKEQAEQSGAVPEEAPPAVKEEEKEEDRDVAMAQEDEAAAATAVESSALSTPGPLPQAQPAPIPMDEDKATTAAPAPINTGVPAAAAPPPDSPRPGSSPTTRSNRATKSPTTSRRGSPTSPAPAPPSSRPMMTRRRSRQQSDDATVAAAAAAAATRARSPPPPLTIGQSTTAAATGAKGATVSPTAGRRRSSGQGQGQGQGATSSSTGSGGAGDDGQQQQQHRRSPTTRRSARDVKKEDDATPPPLSSPTSASFGGVGGAGSGPTTRRRSQSSRGSG